MGASRFRPGPDLATDRSRQEITPAAVAEFAVGQVLRNDAALDALPAILARLVTAFAARSALALQPRTAQAPVVLAAHPDSAAADQALLTEIGALSAAPGASAAHSGSRQVPLTSGGPSTSAMLAYSPLADGQCLCALALVGDASGWDEETRSIMQVVATAVAAQIRHANDAAELVSQHISERKGLEEQRKRLLEAELASRRSADLVQRQLEQQNEKLRELDEAKTQFLATASHELRTPLTSIVSFSDLMRAEIRSVTPDGAQFLDIIERNAHRLLRLVGDLLLLIQLESGSIPLELARVSIPELTEEAARAASAGAAKHGVTVHFSADDGPLVQADRTRLFQVLDNLIANAVKFSGANGLVRVDAISEGRGWRIDVADCGIGIPPGEIGQLFDRFVRASNARTAGLPGSGLGLSVVKAIVELHGGRVTVDSTLGRGTTFSVYLATGT